MIAAKRQHTPGPWVFTEDPFARSPSLTWDINGFHQVAGFHSPQDCKLATVYDVEANARLIAAAPELLEALEACLPDLEHYVATHGPGPDKRLAIARAAIARANEGGAL